MKPARTSASTTTSTSRARPRTGAKLSASAPVFAALGDETRLRIVRRLCESGPQSIVRLRDGASVSRQAFTKHLLALADAGLVRSKRSGRERIWELKTQRLVDVRRALDQISEEWDAAIGRLKNFVVKD